MQDNYAKTTNGTELTIADFNAVAAEASCADDVVLAELLRMAPGGKGVMPFGSVGLNGGIGAVGNHVNLDTTISGLRVRQMRAVVCLADGTLRSAVYSATTPVIPPNGSGTAHVHLVYAVLHVDVINASTVLLKDSSSTVVAPVLANGNARTYVTVGLVSANAPTLPTLPTDTTGVYYIPLAYVRTGTSYAGGGVSSADILDVAPILNDFRHNTGVANKVLYVAKPGDDIAGWAAGGSRPSMYAPQAMTGLVKRTVAFNVNANDLAADFLVDDSIDWRNRVFKSTYQLSTSSSGGSTFVWTGGSNSLPSFGSGLATQGGMGNSINVNATTTRYTAWRSDSGTDSAVWSGGYSAGYFELYVDTSTGSLRGKHGYPSGSTASISAIVLLQASGHFGNV